MNGEGRLRGNLSLRDLKIVGPDMSVSENKDSLQLPIFTPRVSRSLTFQSVLFWTWSACSSSGDCTRLCETLCSSQREHNTTQSGWYTLISLCASPAVLFAAANCLLNSVGRLRHEFATRHGRPRQVVSVGQLEADETNNSGGVEQGSHSR